jgi:ribosome-binding factor A
MSRGPRMRRVNELLRELIAGEVARLKEPRLGFVTITGVDTAPDLRSARVYYSVLGDEAQQRDTREALERASPHVRHEVGRQVRLKYIPELRFEIDEAIDRGMRMEALLRDLREGHDERSDPPADSHSG